jgi:hypothetical protein
MLRGVPGSVRKWFLGWVRLTPHFVVGGADSPYLKRWYVIPRNPVFNVYLHQFLRDDDDRALHDHPSDNVSILLVGSYREHLESGSRVKCAGDVIRRTATMPHRIQLITKTCWTLFITGPRKRVWGFHCPRGWIPWQEFVDQNDAGNVGKGCP